MTTAAADERGASGAAFADDPEAISATGLTGWSGLLHPVNFIALGWTLFQLSLLYWQTTDILIKRSGHVGFACALGLALLLFSGDRLSRTMKFVVGLAILLVCLSPAIYIYMSMERIYDRVPEIDDVLTLDYVFGSLLLGLVIVISYFRIGWGLVALTLVFIGYQLLAPYTSGFLAHNIRGVAIFMDTLFLGQQGLFGIPTGISTNVIFYFILFAAIYDIYGGGRLIIDMALWVTGRRMGGPAKAAVVASALTGSISGSAVANVMSTGIFTIPLMKRVGYSSEFAGGTEAAASTGGQIMPPVMGAGAFIMADFLQVPYQHVVLGALIPSLLYFAGIFAAVDLQARRSNIKRLTREEIGSIATAFRERWHMLLPLIWLIGQIVRGYDVISAVVEASALTVVFGSLRASTRMPMMTLVEALIRAAERTVVVALPCALASIVVMVISLTGLGTKLSSVIVDISAGNLWLAVAFGGIGCLILGCGMPTTSAYIMAAILVAPALAKLGVDPMVGHLYIFYVAVLANVTPPVALAAYAAASVAGSAANKTSWRAFSLAMPGLAVAWAMILQPSIVKWGSPAELSFAVLQAFLANMAISVAVVGWLGRPLNAAMRAGAGVIAVLMLTPTLNTSLIGLAGFAGLVVYGYASSRHAIRA